MITEVTQPVPSIEYPVSTPEEDLRWFVSVQKPRYSDQMESGVFCFVARLSIKGKSIKDLTPSLVALEPFKKDLKAVVVESTYNWYWGGGRA